MRIRQLDLIAFGHFTNRSIDLSQGNLGLHMIYGPNEAGKSTSLRALTAFLFGF
ncbi:MAG: AAA family ATPase, partial [Pirellulaceae bacterium]